MHHIMTSVFILVFEGTKHKISMLETPALEIFRAASRVSPLEDGHENELLMFAECEILSASADGNEDMHRMLYRN